MRIRNEARRWRFTLLATVVCGSVMGPHCGSLPDVVTEEVVGDVCESLHGNACGVPCTRDQDCAAGLYCGVDAVCSAKCGGAIVCPSGQLCSERGRCEDLVPVSTSTGTGSGGTGSIIVTTSTGQSGAGGGECAAVSERATLVKRPMDIVVSIDNSGSMAGEIVAVQNRINSEFAEIIENSGIDYRVIMVTRYGNVHQEDEGEGEPFGVCIGDPLSNLSCPAGPQANTPAVAHNAPTFFHHSTDIGSRNMWCRLLEAYDESDPYPDQREDWVPIAPDGWQVFLRPQAFKVFIAITDDAPANDEDNGCNDTDFTDDVDGALAFDQALRQMSPEHFGAFDPDDPDLNRNYAWYSIVGMAGNDTVSPTPLGPEAPVEGQCCQASGDAVQCPGGNNVPIGDGVRNGEGYQELSRLTGALRYPSCYNDNFDDVFNAIAVGVIEGARLDCEWAIPEPPEGEVFDKDKVNVEFLPGTGEASISIKKVVSANQCAAVGGWFYDDEAAPTEVRVCPATCTLLQSDPAGEVNVLFGCATEFEVVE